MQYRKFDSAAYAGNDSRAKLAFSGLFTAAGCTVTESGAYDIDLSIRRPDGSMLDLDVECRTSPRWVTSGEFPFSTLEIGLRRREKIAGNPGLVFGVMNRDGTSWIAASGATFAAYGAEVAKTVGGKLDMFLSIPAGLAMQGSFPAVHSKL